jgi:ABC-2 type transport system permease protein
LRISIFGFIFGKDLMSAIVLNRLARVLNLTWLTGPIFDKEMRVTSRRRRSYVLRFLYIGLFTSLLALVWLSQIPSGGTWAYRASRMAVAGQVLVGTVLWFQFLTAQVIAAVMLSTAISDEITHRTLGVLMTTPVGSFQIVIGKLLSRLLQLAILLAISLPLLAIVRVFGGVPWGFVVSGLCVTLTTALFVGSLSLFFSIFTRRAYAVMIATILAIGFLFALLPLGVAFLIYYPKDPSPAFLHAVSYVNPYWVVGVATASLAGAPPIAVAAWQAHCGVMLGASGLLLLVVTAFVRKAALRQATGQTGLWSGRRARGPEKSMAEGHIRRVVGPPVFWKECRVPLLGRRRVANLIGAIGVVALLGLTYWLGYREGLLDDRDTHAAYMIVLFAVGMLFTTVIPATSIASEKESQTWPLLLTSIVDEWEILAGKFGGALRRCLPAWTLLFGHVLVFTAWGPIRPAAVLQLGILVVWVVVFLSGTGLYLSTRLKHPTTAVIANMGVAAGLWAVVPLLMGILVAIGYVESEVIELYLDMNPFVHAGVIAMATAQKGSPAAYEWVQGGMSSVTDATFWMLFTAFIHTVVAAILAAWAAVRMRRYPL